MAEQITAAADEFGADSLTIIDVGGDALTKWSRPWTTQPLADQLAIAACLRSGLPGRLIIAAPGVDGEIPGHAWTAIQRPQQRSPATLTGEHLDAVRGVFEWHPSEASGLLLAVADAHRGYVQVRDAGDQIALTDDTASLHNLDLDQVRPHIPAAELINAASLADAEAITEHITGISELRYETQKATRRNGSPAYKITVDDLRQVYQHADQAAEQGADYIRMRRLAELIGATTFEGFAALDELLAQHRSDRYGRSIYVFRHLTCDRFPSPDVRHLL
jgi:hypothetical protein